MAARRPVKVGEAERIFEDIQKNIGKIYLLWLLGIVAGAVRLKLSAISFGGVTFGMENPDVVEGVIFLACICYYIVLCMPGIKAAGLPPYTTWALRRAIYSSILYRDRSLTKRTGQEIKTIKLMARGHRCYVRFASLIYYVLPLAHILLFRRAAVWEATKVIFSS